MEADFADGFDSGSPWEGSDNFPLGGNTFGTIIEDGRDGTSSPSNDEPQTGHLDFESLTADQVANLSPTVIETLTASQLRSTVIGTQRSVLASLYYSQLEAISATAMHQLSLNDLMQTSVLTPYGRTITVLQAMPWANLSSLSREVIGTLTVDQLELTNLQEQSFTNSARTLLQSLSDEQILQLSNKTIHGLSREKLMQTNVNGTAVWHVLILDSATVDLLPAEFQPRNLTATQVTSLFTHLAQSKTLHALNANVLRTIPTASLVNGILGLEISIARAFITDLSDIQLAAFTPAAVNGLVTSSKDMAAIFLNAGAYGSLSINQFQALLGGATHIGDIHESVLSNYLSVRALQSLTPSQINELTASQFAKLLTNETLSKVIFNAGQPGAWAMEQLQAVSALAISQMTQGQYLQFSGGLALFSEPQQEAMATNVNLLEIMLTGQTGVWTQDEIAWMVENIPGMIPLASLPGGGNEPNRGNNGDREERERLAVHRVSAYQTMNSHTSIRAALTRVGWRSLSEEDQNGLLANRNLPYVLADLNQAALVNLLRNENLLPKLREENLNALITSINNHLDISIGPQAAPWSLEQVNHLIDHVLNGGLRALVVIVKTAPRALAGVQLSETHVNTLINSDVGLFVRIVINARNLLPHPELTEAQIIAIINQRNGPEHLWRIAIYSPNALPPNVLTANIVNTLISVNEPFGLRVLGNFMVIGNLAPDSLSLESVNALLNTEAGEKILLDIAFNWPISFQMSSGLVRMLIERGREGGFRVLRRYGFAARLDFNYLTVENLKTLINTQGGLDVLASIAKASKTALVGCLTTDVVMLLCDTLGGFEVLSQIAISAPGALIGTLNKDIVNQLIRRRGGLAVLTSIAQNAPNAIADDLFTVDHVIRLLDNPTDGMRALIAIANFRVAAFGTSMAELSSVQASHLPVEFWAAINEDQLRAMFTSATLGAEYFNISSEAPNTPHISEVSLQSIRPEVLLSVYENGSNVVRTVIVNSQKFFDPAQLAIFISNNHNEFIERGNLNATANNLLLAQPNAVRVNNILVEQSASSTNQVELPGLIILNKNKNGITEVDKLIQAMALVNAPAYAATSAGDGVFKDTSSAIPYLYTPPLVN